MMLKRTPGSKWRANGPKLPGPLIALACDAGSGFVGLGPTEAKKGVRVATVFEDPSVAGSPAFKPRERAFDSSRGDAVARELPMLQIVVFFVRTRSTECRRDSRRRRAHGRSA